MERRDFLICACAAPFAIKEALAGGEPNKVRLRVPFMLVDKPNKNGRVYSKVIAENVMKQYREHVQIPGQIGMRDSSVTEFSKMSHQVSNLSYQTVEGQQWLCGEVQVLNTPMGQVLKQMLDKDPNSVAFRTAGVGTVRMNDQNEWIVDPESYKLVGIDAVDATTAA